MTYTWFVGNCLKHHLIMTISRTVQTSDQSQPYFQIHIHQSEALRHSHTNIMVAHMGRDFYVLAACVGGAVYLTLWRSQGVEADTKGN